MTQPNEGEFRARAAVLREQGGAMKLQDLTLTPPRADEVLVRMVGVGICHTDMLCRTGFPVPTPIVLGHEGAGIVEAVGPKVQELRCGDPVVLSFNYCGECRSCRADRPASCWHMMALNFGAPNRAEGGAARGAGDECIHVGFFGQSSFASYAVARERNAVRIPAEAPLELCGPLGCGVQTGAGAVLNSLAVQKGDSLLVIGAGAVGLSAVLAAVVARAERIIVIEPKANRRKLAEDLGATDVFPPASKDDLAGRVRAIAGGGVSHALDTTGNTDMIEAAIECVAPGGTVGLVGVPPAPSVLATPVLDILIRNVTLRPITEGDAHPKRFIPYLADLFLQGRLPFDRMIERFPFEEIESAFDAAAGGRVVKPVLIF